ncbi:hypothetical protein [Micromonospora sp. 067-2]|uniref:hypothetical protein n=1 Tax=Micromonospora sp. 067-2 TaxID=2789270 RepID=UPI00397D281C
MTQPPSYPTPPVGGLRPAAGGFAPPPGPHPQGYAVAWQQCLHAQFAARVVVKVSE